MPGTRAPPEKIAPGTTGPKKLRTLRKAQGQQPAAETVHQRQPRGRVGLFAEVAVGADVVGNLREHVVRLAVEGK